MQVQVPASARFRPTACIEALLVLTVASRRAAVVQQTFVFLTVFLALPVSLSIRKCKLFCGAIGNVARRMS